MDAGWWLDGQIVDIKVRKTNDTSHGHSNAKSGGNSEVKVMATVIGQVMYKVMEQLWQMTW